MAIAQVLVIIILQSLNLSHILSSFIKILIQYFFLTNQLTGFQFVRWNTIVILISCKWSLLGPHRTPKTILAISFILSLPLLLILVFHIQRFITYRHAVIHISPCELIKKQSFSCSEASLLCCFIWRTRMKKAWGRKTMLSALTHLAAWHWGIRHQQGRENILSDIVTLCRNLREAEAAVTHLVVSSTAYDYNSSCYPRRNHRSVVLF